MQLKNLFFVNTFKRIIIIYLILICAQLMVNCTSEDMQGPAVCRSPANSTEENDVYFWLASRSTTDGPIISKVTDERMFGGAYDPQHPTILVINGYLNTPTFTNDTIRTYLAAYDGVVLATFWDAAICNYTIARTHIESVAAIVALFLERMVVEETLDLQSLTVMGFSMGAQIAGIAGRRLGGKIPTMIGLDAASPLFIPGGESSIDTDSAGFVQVIHSSVTAEGMSTPIGHVDFYPNGGLPPQPGCENFTDYMWTLCSHVRAPDFFIETFGSPFAFPAVQCSSYERFLEGACDNNVQVYMGYNMTRSARGTFYLQTRSASPYGHSDSSNWMNDRSVTADEMNSERMDTRMKRHVSSNIPTSTNYSQELRVHFYLYNRNSQMTPVITHLNDERLFGGLFDASRSSSVLIPTYNYDNITSDSPFIDSMLEVLNGTVMVVHWNAAADEYRKAVSQIYGVAEVVAAFLLRMEQEERLDLQSLRMIGHGVGAHISGTAGRLVNGQVSTMIGLDPVNLLFVPGNRNVIDKKSAEFVEIIHTSGTVVGIQEPLGHVDFYVNGGLPPQPGCWSVDYLFPIDPIYCASCSHIERVVDLYVESVTNPWAFPAYKCRHYELFIKRRCNRNKMTYMGHHTRKSTRGRFFLTTRQKAPYRLNYIEDDNE